MNTLTRSGIDYTLLFYNPNIHPEREYRLRKSENKRYADALRVPFVDLDYDRRMIALARAERFYQQEYCGCVYSLRDTNRARRARGDDKIRFGVRFYGRE